MLVCSAAGCLNRPSLLMIHLSQHHVALSISLADILIPNCAPLLQYVKEWHEGRGDLNVRLGKWGQLLGSAIGRVRELNFDQPMTGALKGVIFPCLCPWPFLLDR